MHVYIFNHIPKCGGHSVVDILKSWGKVILTYNDSKINGLMQNQILCGHNLINKYPFLLNDKRCCVFSFVRDPLSLSISLYYYYRNRNKLSDIDINNGLINSSNNSPNILSQYLGCNKNNYKMIIDNYFFIGIFEKFQESFNALCTLTNHICVKLPIINKSIKDNQKITNEVIDYFKEKNMFDYQMYNYIYHKYEQTINCIKSKGIVL